MSRERAVGLSFEGEELEGVFVGRRDGQRRPTVILIPTVMGVSELEKGFGRQLVELGRHHHALDGRPLARRNAADELEQLLVLGLQPAADIDQRHQR